MAVLIHDGNVARSTTREIGHREDPHDDRALATPGRVPATVPDDVIDTGSTFAYCRQCDGWLILSADRTLSVHSTSDGRVTYFRCPAGHAGVSVGSAGVVEQLAIRPG